MKKIFVIASFFSCTSLFAQSDKYTAAMQKSLAMLDSATELRTLQLVAGNFERIAKVEKNQWLPYYYAGFCTMQLANNSSGIAIDARADQAEAFLNKADSLGGDKSEINCVRAQLAFARINVDFMKRGQQYSEYAHQSLAEAQLLNPQNPRAYLLQGQALYATPESFGGDKKAGCKLMNEALSLFAKADQKSLLPYWGKKTTQDMLKKCVTQ